MTGKIRSEYLFSAAGLADLEAFIDHETLYAFDLDGTLAPIAYEPHLITIDEKIKNALLHLMKIAPVAVLTGRSASDARNHLGFDPNYLIGNHGAQGLPSHIGNESAHKLLTNAWHKQIGACLARLRGQGVMIENKGESLSIHYRNATNREEAKKGILKCVSRLKPKPRHVSGKYVENIIPADAPDKGQALLELLNCSKLSKAIYAGDDETDEDVFRIGEKRFFCVHVGSARRTAARYYLKRQDEIYPMIQKIISTLMK